MNIVTNNLPRPLLDWSELTPAEQKEFLSYIDPAKPDTDLYARFVRYKGWVYDMHDQMRAPESIPGAWDAYQGDSFFSGVLFKYTEDFNGVICGRYYA